MTTTDERLDNVEMKLAYQDESIEALSEALIEKEKRIAVLEDTVEKLQQALRILAERQRTGNPEVGGKLDFDDPVPRSG